MVNKMNALALKKDYKEPKSRVRTLNIWPRDFYTNFRNAKGLGVTPLSLKETMETVRNPEEVKQIIRENRDKLEAYLQGNSEMYVTARECWKLELNKLGILWTGTIGAYTWSWEPLGKEIQSTECAMGPHFNMRFPVPKKFRGIEHALLLVEFPDYELINEGRNGTGGLDILIKAKAGTVHLIREFPSWEMSNISLFRTELRHNVPCREPVCSSWEQTPPAGAVELMRNPGPFVGAVTVMAERQIIALTEPMSRNYCRMLVGEIIDGDTNETNV